MILDTNAVSDLLGGNSALGKILSGQHQHQLPVIVIGEYRFGIIRSRRESRLRPFLAQLIADSEILEVGLETTAFYARVREQLYRSGTPIPQNDLWIAALAIQHQQPLISRDAHFDQVAGLRRLSWRA